jgi:ActR/RegA family two-component response regulator
MMVYSFVVLSALLVENDTVVRRLLARSLRARVEVDEASGVADALEKLGVVVYDLIITNDRLPDGSGRGLLAYVRDSDAGCRRALTSTSFPVTLGGDISYERFFLVPNELDALVLWVDHIRSV